MGGIIEDINEGGITMAFLYLNDWSMTGEGNLSSQWSKVERWYGLMTHLSDTYGIAKIGVPHDFKTRELCGYQLSLCYNPSDETLAEGEQKITGIIKPQINYKGKMIQSAQITVSQNL